MDFQIRKLLAATEDGKRKLSGAALITHFRFWCHDVGNRFSVATSYLQMITREDEAAGAAITHFSPMEFSSVGESLRNFRAYDPDFHLSFVDGVTNAAHTTLREIDLYYRDKSRGDFAEEIDEIISNLQRLVEITSYYRPLFVNGSIQIEPISITTKGDGYFCHFHVARHCRFSIVGSLALFNILLGNILTNATEAIQSTGLHRKPQVLIGMDGTWVNLEFRNHGRIPDHLLHRNDPEGPQRIFVAGESTRAGHGSQHGTGGAVIYEMAMLMNGTVRAENDGKEAVITVTLPQAA